MFAGAPVSWSLRASLSGLPEDELEQACNDCGSLARAIIGRWPSRKRRWFDSGKDDQPWLAGFAIELPKLDDPRLVAGLLRVLAERDSTLKVEKLVIDACRRFEADDMQAMLKDVLSYQEPPHPRRAPSEPQFYFRDAAWLSKLACDSKQGGLSKGQLTELCQIAVERFDAWAEESKNYPGHGMQLTESMSALLKVSLAISDEASTERLLNQMQTFPSTFDVKSFRVKACTDLIQWADKRLTQRPIQLDAWLDSIRETLQSATTQLPAPPSDFTRDSQTGCFCKCCEELSEFLADSTAETGTIRSLKDELEHVQQKIGSAKLDVTSVLDRSTRPFSLLLTKTNDSHERAVKQHHADIKLLESLPAAARQRKAK